MDQSQEKIIRRLGQALRTASEDTTSARLPTRWVDLIRYLDQIERDEAATGSRRQGTQFKRV
jgi:hypothetical protein